MADPTDLRNYDVVRSLTPNDVDKLRNVQLKQALSTLINQPRESEPSNAVLLAELQSMKQSLKELTILKQEVTCLSQRLNDAYKTIHQQQLFLEYLDNKDRKLNLVITGVSESPDELGSTDEEKIGKVMEATGCSAATDRHGWITRRLGAPNERNMRPIHVTVNNQSQRDNIARSGKNLKSASQPLSRVYIKKDVHPAVRRENARLRKREREEKEKPENVGVTIQYDWKNRVLLRDGAVIDRFAPNFF